MQDDATPSRLVFRNDYSEGAHPRILEALVRASNEQNAGYGCDRHSVRAAELIRALAGQPSAAVHLLSSGTQTNLVALSAFLRPHQAVIAADSGHIATHETGAIEATGHKVLVAPSTDGKLAPVDVEALLDAHGNEHMVQPRLVYVSNSTESGTVYSRSELAALSALCRARGLLLFVDGARLGAALTADANDMTLADIAALVDAFYIGGTKNGALLGEALVVVHPGLQQDLRYLIKQRGALLAKGMVLGVQFETLFEDGLYFELARHANRMAARLHAGLLGNGAEFAAPLATNQLLLLVTDDEASALAAICEFQPWQSLGGGRQVVRLATSWATREDAVDALVHAHAALMRAHASASHAPSDRAVAS
jgi:threonine aldolase